MSFTKGPLLYEGKAKQIYTVVGQDDLVWMSFKNSLTAFNAQKKGEMEDKGLMNSKITQLVFKYLEELGVNTHMVQRMSETEMVCDRVEVIPLEVVVRNVVAGSLAKKFNIKEGEKLSRPLVEFYYKDDDLGDPFISDEQVLVFGFAKSQSVLDELKSLALKINDGLIKYFEKCGINLVDFKLEFGTNSKGELLLADEITPDSCRLWDVKTGEKMDKDRFRRDLGNVKENYQEVLKRIQTNWGE